MKYQRYENSVKWVLWNIHEKYYENNAMKRFHRIYHWTFPANFIGATYENLQPYENVSRSIGYFHRYTYEILSSTKLGVSYEIYRLWKCYEINSTRSYEISASVGDRKPMKIVWAMNILWNALGIGSYGIDKKHYEIKQATVWNNKYNMLHITV